MKPATHICAKQSNAEDVVAICVWFIQVGPLIFIYIYIYIHIYIYICNSPHQRTGVRGPDIKHTVKYEDFYMRYNI